MIFPTREMAETYLGRERRTLPPATGVCRWNGVDRATGNRLLLINAKEYEVERVIGGFYITLLDWYSSRPSLQLYRISTQGEWTCDCPDATNRPERKHACKHVRALKAAIAAQPYDD